ncbi:hypothetical protein [Hansschlegelia zhihuaiae]|uniref:Uncharacterized protein n=1 Tax=Hansschlegelia zhihuaiae TaxID=405005 RepID=A0A4Q0M423_9HYPH|nr:hypothetical protein [Hansschlegelia zhihuaiae]RXF67563.1 hypothetical protein EK403_21260 [Hansschlegelia zhihuaiae]
MSSKPDIVTVLRAAAVIPEDIRPEEFRRLLFDAAAMIERLRDHAVTSDLGATRDAKTIETLQDALAAYRKAIEEEPT